MCGSLENLDYMVKMHALAPSLTPHLGQDGKLWNGRNGRSGKLSHSSDVIGVFVLMM